MALQDNARRSFRSSHPLAVELGMISAMLVGVFLWREVVREALPAVVATLPGIDGIVFNALVSGGLLLGGIVVLAGAYATVRNIDVALRLPSRDDGALASITALVPVVCVAITKLVGTVTGVPYNSLIKTSVAADAPLFGVLLVTGLGVIVGVPVLVVICQILIQGSFRKAARGKVAVGLTTVLAWFVMVSNTGGMATVPALGKLLGTVVFTLSVGMALYAAEQIERRWFRYLGFAPVLLITTMIVLSGVAAVQTITGGLYAVTHLAVFGVAAYAYDETESFLVPALAYGSLELANTTVVFVFEAGMQSW